MVKVRAQQIYIDLPTEGAEPWIRVVVQRVERSGNIVNVVDRWDSLNKRVSVVANDEFLTPVTCGDGRFTVGMASTIISSIVIGWMQEKYGGSVNEDGDLILEA